MDHPTTTTTHASPRTTADDAVAAAAHAWRLQTRDRPRVAPHVPLVIHVRGSQEEMGAQHGRLLRPLGGFETVLEFYPTMAARLIASGLPHSTRARAEGLLRRVLAVGLEPLQRARERRHPAYAARSRAFFAALGLDPRLARNLLVMDLFQNAIALLGRAGLLEKSRAGTAPAPGCSSLAVWDDASVDGSLRHARNFDFPGIGIWDAAPVVVFCDPSEAPGLRYGFVTTRGADTPGVTAFNEAGLTCVMHTRFHRAISFRGVPAVDLGHEVVRRAETLDDAVRVLRELPSASTWGLLVSSARERSAVLVELHANGSAVVRPAPQASFLATANRYQAAALQRGEVTTSPVFAVDSDARLARLEALAEQATARGRGLDTSELEAALGDICDASAAPGALPATRCAGNTIAVSMTVKSVVSEPEARQIRVSVGVAPTGWGPYLPVAWDWSAPVGVRALEPAVLDEARHHVPVRDDGLVLDEPQQRAMALHTEASRLHQNGEATPAQLRELAERCVELVPDDPHFRLLAAFCALEVGEPAAALAHLEHGLQLEGGTFRHAQMLLWASRAAHVLGRPEAAQRYREALAALSHPHIGSYQAAAQREARRPMSARRLRSIAVNISAIDAT